MYVFHIVYIFSRTLLSILTTQLESSQDVISLTPVVVQLILWCKGRLVRKWKKKKTE